VGNGEVANEYYVEISNIHAACLNDVYRLTITNAHEETQTIEITAMWYVAKLRSGEPVEGVTVTDELQAMLEAMYWYNNYADAFFATEE
ncbi:MAG: hypothetical protein IJV73_08105, partial [Clostridia bacterium]|nr:hypothetical protein [Clostridia bacterium]